MATSARRRRAPTDEQKAKSAERRERFRNLCREIAALSDDDRARLVSRAGGILNCEGRPLSVHNSCLLLSQFSGVSVVGGFWQWQKSGRRVRKGATGLSLWIPTKGKGEEIPGADAGADVEPAEPGAKKSGRGRFIVGTVFDITSTEPMDAPESVAVDAGYPSDEPADLDQAE